MKIKKTQALASLLKLIKEFEKAANEIGGEFLLDSSIGICADLHELRTGGIVFTYYGYGESREQGKSHRQVKVFHDFKNNPSQCKDISSYKMEFYLDSVLQRSCYFPVEFAWSVAGETVNFLWKR